MALLLLLRPLMLQEHFAAAGDPSGHQDERAVGVDSQRLGFLLEVFAKRIIPTNTNWNLHENALAAPPHRGIRWRALALCHAVLFLNYTRRTSVVERNTTVCIPL